MWDFSGYLFLLPFLWARLNCNCRIIKILIRIKSLICSLKIRLDSCMEVSLDYFLHNPFLYMFVFVKHFFKSFEIFNMSKISINRIYWIADFLCNLLNHQSSNVLRTLGINSQEQWVSHSIVRRLNRHWSEPSLFVPFVTVTVTISHATTNQQRTLPALCN